MIGLVLVLFLLSVFISTWSGYVLFGLITVLMSWFMAVHVVWIALRGNVKLLLTMTIYDLRSCGFDWDVFSITVLVGAHEAT